MKSEYVPTLAYPDRKMPRPDDPELLERAAFAAREGMSRRAAAGHCVMAQATLDDWLLDGRQELRRFDAGEVEELGSRGRFAAIWESNYALFEAEQIHYLNAGKQGSKGNSWQPAMAHLRSRNHQWIETVIIDSHTAINVTYRLELGTAEAAILARVQELIDHPPVPNKLLPESTK